ncbi:MAG TPA: hypothetical protein VGK40_11240 [Verrucomicrobiae bacterium]
MNVLILNRAKMTAVTLAVGALCCLGGPRLFAGDPIDFSGGRGKNSGPKESKMDEERLKALQSPTSPSILREGAPPDSMPSINKQPRDPREERRQRLAREERKYFLLYEPGELQKKERGGKDTGLGDYSLGGRDEKSLGRNWLSDDPTGSSKPAGSKGAANRKDDRSEDMESRARQNEDAETERKKGEHTSFTGQSGAHSAKELEFKDVLNSNPSRGEAPSSFDKADFTLRDMLGAPETSRSRAQDTRMDSFRQMLNGSPASGSLNPPRDAARLPGAHPPSDRAFDNVSRTGGRDAFAPPSAASPDFGNKLRSAAADNTYQRPTPFQIAGPSSFSPSDASRTRVPPADFEALKKRMR